MKIYFGIIGFTLLVGLGSAWANPGGLEQADALIMAGKYSACLKVLEKDLAAAATAAEKVEILWRLSRAAYFAAEQDRNRTDDAALVSRGNEKGAAYAEQAVKLDGRSAQAYFWRSANWGSWAQQNPNLSALPKLNLAKDDLIRALSLQPDFPDAYYALGSLYANVPGWPVSFGNKEFGVSLLRRAIDTIGAKKEILRGYIALADVLWERNWNSGTRKNRQVQMKAVFDKKAAPVEKYCYYEGAIDYNRVSEYAKRSLSSLSDREEARLLLDYAEKQITRMVPSNEERDALRHAIVRVRKKW